MNYKTLNKRIDKLDKAIQNKNYVPVLFVDTEEEIEQHRDKIGPDTVVIIDIPREWAL